MILCMVPGQAAFSITGELSGSPTPAEAEYIGQTRDQTALPRVFVKCSTKKTNHKLETECQEISLRHH